MTSTAVYTAHISSTPIRFGAPAYLPLLTAAEQAGVPGLKLESSCRNGTCRTCIGQLQSGQVRYAVEWPGLSGEEQAEGFVLPCVAYPFSDVVLRQGY